jgi:dTDP-glucose 4,6-dehydratase
VRLSRSGEHEPVNIGNPDEFTVLEAARLILDLTGSASKIIFQSAMVDDPQQRRPDIARAQKHLGWSPKISLRQGLVETIEHFRQVAAGGPNLPKNLDAPDPDFRT